MLRAFTVYPARTATVHGEDVQSYAELADATARLVTLLKESGLTPGTHAVLVSPNTPDALLAFHAVPLAGGVIVPLNPAFSDEALNFLAGHADPVVALVDSTCLGRVGGRLRKLAVPIIEIGKASDLDARLSVVSPSALELPAALDEDSPISVNYTSGTTSDPKGVMVTHRNAYINLSNLLYHLNLRPGSVYLHALPLAHGNGWGSAWAVTAAGGAHVMPGGDEPRELRQALLTRGITHLFASPTILTPLADAAAPLTLPRPVKLLVAGTRPPPRLLGQLQAQGFEVLHGYGLTETNAVMTVNETAGADALPSPQGHPMMFGGQVRVVSEDGQPVPPDGFTPGEIVIRGNQVMKGYYKNRAATRRALEGGWLHTGDLAVVHPGGQVDILDRAGDLLNIGGQSVSSAQIEAVLYRHPSVREAVVVAGHDRADGVCAVAFVTLHAGAGVRGDELLSFCAPHLPDYALPRRVQLVSALPKTASGKVLKHVLRTQARQESGAAAR
ncbi:AMP-binding protein [Deinococcus radiopugnans]|uniref:AMP-binding protein n=2 Tax=Deinococcus radiopugnans TaxID=57497 RepID=A0A5C4Y5W3_9DEIO|nr:AMP-binding protein [Deinococcus radiopugnans]MBB6016686.1 fatty-acyl-CoA synthase [Deinococcus radiopugnans ATCC 19172]TNM70801.1 AMP-binding protein [Deinococcus radiopugnans ATCC 19172]